MECENLTNYSNISDKNDKSFKTNIKGLETSQIEKTIQKNIHSENLEDCAQILNEEILNTQKKFTETSKEDGLNITSNLENLGIQDLKTPVKESLSATLKTTPRQRNSKINILELIEKCSLVSTIKKNLKKIRLFKSPEMDYSRFRVRGRLFVSKSRINQIKKNLRRTKLQRTIIKPNKKLRIRPLQNKLIKREYLRKRKRDMGDLYDYAREINCCRCNILIKYTNNIFNKEYFWKSGDREKIRIQDEFTPYKQICNKCEKKQKNALYPRSENNDIEILKKPFLDWSTNTRDSDLEKQSRNSITSNLSEISLKNMQKKTNYKFKLEEISKVKKRDLEHVHDGQFVSSSKRRTEYFLFYRNEGDKLTFEGNLDKKLHRVRHDDDYDTDEELIDTHLKIIAGGLLKGLDKVNRRKR